MRSAGVFELRRLMLAVLFVGIGATAAVAQGRGHVTGTIGAMVAAQPATLSRLGGATWTGTIAAGADVSRHVGIEVEASFGGELSAKTYTYRPSLDRVVEVETHGRDTALGVQLRGRAGRLEPVAGLCYVRTSMRTHSVFVPGGGTYFDHESATDAIGVVAGLDAAVGVTSHVAIVPSFRGLVIGHASRTASGSTLAGPGVLLRAGVGARLMF